ncbi:MULTISPECIES: peptidoglycan-binding domain-containing protein [unclassified Nostoc]|uniref:peptidoglycan-binding domain-containing protein n=1 Tax=unclassified Nostoc TaxID=2593658 RepID=UPI002AD3257C|nr:peptidoglycan-binding domain-containing protein [Nostoc sp. DedQUE03]MDZ7971729.1 peptidoglycan-binding domain-containing protein [Nostoc sp. DedQUE03]MDZ8047305.1 peptidoglycan-binding domain-containing protein [Nostoc sp. DedQUE02]
MNWKVLALLPALTLATAVPAYSLTNNKSQNTATTTYVAQSTKKTNAVPKLNAKRKSNNVAKRSTGNVLTVGSRGETVKTVQNSLKQQGFYTASVNGVFDNKTRAAVIKFQKSKGLRADGIIGHRTLAALK